MEREREKVVAERYDLFRSVTARIERADTERDETLARLQAEHEREIAQLAAEAQKDAIALRRQIEDGLNERETLLAEHRNRIKDLIAEREEAAAALTASRAAGEEATLRVRDEHSAQLTQAHAEYETKVAETAAELDRERALREERERTLDATIAKWESALQARESEILALKADRALLLEQARETEALVVKSAGERDILLNQAKADAESKLEAAIAMRDAAQAAWQRAEALASAQAAAHGRVTAQWATDFDALRKRLQLVVGDRTELEAKLREAEIALEAAGGSVVGTAA